MKKIFFTIFFILIMFLVSIRCYASNEDLIGLIEDLECECTTLWEEYESYFDGDNDYNDTDNYENFYADYIVVDAGGVTEPEIYDLTGLSEEELEMFRKLKKTNFDSFETKYDDIFIMKSMIVQNTGSYTLYSKLAIIWLFNSEGKALLSIEERGKIYLYKNDNVYAMFLYFGPGDI